MCEVDGPGSSAARTDAGCFFGPLGPRARVAVPPSPRLRYFFPEFCFFSGSDIEAKDGHGYVVQRMDPLDVSLVDYEVSLKVEQQFCTFEEFLEKSFMPVSSPRTTNEAPGDSDKSQSPRANGFETQDDGNQIYGVEGETRLHPGDISYIHRDFRRFRFQRVEKLYRLGI
jgi:hypothetical protein